MQPIIVLGVAAVAVALVGTGFLGEPWNEFELWVQQLGWGEADIDSPISHATVDLNIKKELNDNGTTEADCQRGNGGDLNGPQTNNNEETFEECIARVTTDDYFTNTISHCSFHSDDSIPAAMTGDILDQVSPGVLICKLTDDRDLAIVEGKLFFDEYTRSEHLFIKLDQVAFEGANDVQAPIHDVKLIVEAPV